MKYIKLAGKIVFFSILAFIFGMFFLRLFFLNTEGPAKDIIWTASAKEEYYSDREAFKISWFEASEYLSEDGYISILETRYLENIKQLQFTVRYRDSNIKKIAQKYGSDSAENGDLVYSLFITTKEGVNTLTSYTEVNSSKLFYNYDRLVFDNVELDAEDLVNVGINIYYKTGDTSKACESMKIADSRTVRLDYDFSKELPGYTEYETGKVNY